MNQPSDFVGQLEDQLRQGAERLAGRRRSRLRAGAAVAVIAAIGIGGVTIGGWLPDGSKQANEIAAIEIGGTGDTERSDERRSSVTAEAATTGSLPVTDDPVTFSVGDGTTVSRVTAVDGSVFMVRLPAAFGQDIRGVTPGDPTTIAALRGADFGARIEIGFCTSETLAPNALGLPMAPVRLSRPPPDVSFCRPDEFVRFVIDPVPDFNFEADHIDIVPLGFGDHYVDWMATNVGFDGPCCFENRGPMPVEDVLMVADGVTSTQVTALDSTTLVPRWTTDLAQVLEGRGQWVGDGSYLYSTSASGVVVVTTGYGFLIGLDSGTGQPRWTVDLEGTSPAGVASVGLDRLVVSSNLASEGDLSGPTIRLVDVATGAVIWSAEGRAGTDAEWTPPAVLDDMVLVADVPSYGRSGNASILAFDLADGDRRWVAPLDSTTAASSGRRTIFTDDRRDLLLVTDVDGVLYRLDRETGRRLWRSAGLGPVVGLSEATVTVETRGGEVAVDLETGVVVP